MIDNNTPKGVGGWYTKTHVKAMSEKDEALTIHTYPWVTTDAQRLLDRLAALEKVVTEVRGWLGYNEVGLRETLGNTNVQVIKHWIEALDACMCHD